MFKVRDRVKAPGSPGRVFEVIHIDYNFKNMKVLEIAGRWKGTVWSNQRFSTYEHLTPLEELL